MRATATIEIFLVYFFAMFSWHFLPPIFAIAASTATIVLVVFTITNVQKNKKRERAKETAIEKRERAKEIAIEKREKAKEKREIIEHKLRVKKLRRDLGEDNDKMIH
ncbi:MAG: hypothetical protein OXE77_03200 [Flavobacteriaceae bacterium]|nr:hypothetical protein [Flavobacteriaceae bacterium]MCY4267295.1 hypothetical protein [Flavobacteriaceae bacterium]MCY4298480.1 hypothetical protein [Flavobacteriaceae bacterium]